MSCIFDATDGTLARRRADGSEYTLDLVGKQQLPGCLGSFRRCGGERMDDYLGDPNFANLEGGFRHSSVCGRCGAEVEGTTIGTERRR